jgi:hypothetical protein
MIVIKFIAATVILALWLVLTVLSAALLVDSIKYFKKDK